MGCRLAVSQCRWCFLSGGDFAVMAVTIVADVTLSPQPLKLAVSVEVLLIISQTCGPEL